MNRLADSNSGFFALLVLGLFRPVRVLWELLGPAPGWPGFKLWLLRIASLGIMVAVGGFLFAASGIMPITASSGHWPITEWLLNFAMSRSVSTHSVGIKAPELNDEDLVLKGAGHYETGCFPCHGSPVLEEPRIARAMTPHPPYLPPEIHQWEPVELFYIVKHGVKFTGMPAWPAQQRDDEVWATVAFLQKLPELNAQEYQRLVRGEAVAGKETAPIQNLSEPEAASRAVDENCRRCHGADGHGRGSGAFPSLAGQQPEYLESALLAYARGERHSGIMEPIAAGMSRDSIHELARYYRRRVAVPNLAASNSESNAAAKRGESIALQGVPNQRVPICAECHGPGDIPPNVNYPSLAGQHAKYLVLQLELFQKRHRGGSSYANLMHPIADQLTAQQMRDVALYYESLEVPVDQPDP